tara:strand:- start:225 stop:455 length:231 start_codon:yes stop_codon:yes gene_type:complete
LNESQLYEYIKTIDAFSFFTNFQLSYCLKSNVCHFVFSAGILKLRASIDLNQKLVLSNNYEAESEQLQGIKLFNWI